MFDRFFGYIFSGSALSVTAKVLLFSGAFYVMSVTFFLLGFLHNNGTLYGLEEGDNMRCVAAFGKEYGQYCTSFVAGLNNVGVLLYASAKGEDNRPRRPIFGDKAKVFFGEDTGKKKAMYFV